MRPFRIVIVMCLSLLFLSSYASAAGFEISGLGVKARGMGGAFRAIADDWTAAYYNPAGYASIYDNEFGTNLSLVHLRNELVPNYRTGGVYETGILNDQVNYNAHEVLSLPSAGFVVRLPVWGETVFGFSIYQPFDQNITWELYQPLEGYSDNASIPGDQYRHNLDVVAFQLTIAKEYMEEKLALGVGLQVLRGDLLFSNLYFRDNPMPSPLNDRPHDKITQYAKNDGYGFGFGLRTGLMWKVTDKFRVALTGNLPLDINIDGSSSLEFFMPQNNSLWQNSDSANLRNEGTVGQLFVSGAYVVDSADFEADLKLPASVGLGLAYSFGESVTIALDGEVTFWSQFEGYSFKYTNHSGLTGPADSSELARSFFTADLSNPANWSDAFKIMTGVSYNATDYLTLLGGAAIDYRNDQQDETEQDSFLPQLLDQGDRYSLSLGALFHIEQWDLGIVTSFTNHPNLSHPDVISGDNGRSLVSFGGDLNADTYETVLSFGYRF